MKTFWLILIVLFIGIGTANATNLRWDASVGATGYELHYTDSTDGTSWGIDVFNVTGVEFTGIPGHEYLFSVKAYNLAGVSGPSNVVGDTMPEYVPINNPQENTTAAPAPVVLVVE